MPRNILLTGCSGKLGQVILKHFLKLGDFIVFTSRRPEKINQVLEENSTFRDQIKGFQVDLTNPDELKKLTKEIQNNKISIDCLINNARDISNLVIKNGLVAREHFLNEFLLGVIVPYELTMSLALDLENKLKKVVNIGSQYGLVAANPSLYMNYEAESPIHYGVAKAALIHLTKELAVRLAPKNILVNCVAYGGVEGRVDDDFKERYAKLAPLGRMLKEPEIPGPIEYLLSEKSSGMTGHVLAVDGGWSIW